MKEEEMVKTPTFQKAIITGLVSGAIGAIIGFIPFLYLKEFVFEFIVEVFKITGRQLNTLIDILNGALLFIRNIR